MPYSTAREIGESVEVRKAHAPGMRDATPTPAVRKRKPICSLLTMPTTDNILDGKNSNPIADSAIRKVVNVMMFLRVIFRLKSIALLPARALSNMPRQSKTGKG